VQLFFSSRSVCGRNMTTTQTGCVVSITDDLTGLHNLQSFESHLATFGESGEER